MEFNFVYTKDDWIKFYAFLQKDLCKPSEVWYVSAAKNIALWFAIALIFFLFFQKIDEFSWSSAGIVSFFFALIAAEITFTALRYKKRSAPSESGIFIGSHAFKFDESGILTSGKGYSAGHDWSAIQRVVRTDGAIYLFLDTAYGFILPLSQINNVEELYEFINEKVSVR